MASMVYDVPPAATLPVTHELSTTAWLVGERESLPGWLSYQDGRISYRDHSSHLVFQAPLSDVTRVDFPWWRWGAVCRIHLYGTVFTVRFSPPHGGGLAFRVQGMSWLQETLGLARNGPHANPRDVSAAWRAIFRYQ